MKYSLSERNEVKINLKENAEEIKAGSMTDSMGNKDWVQLPRPSGRG